MPLIPSFRALSGLNGFKGVYGCHCKMYPGVATWAPCFPFLFTGLQTFAWSACPAPLHSFDLCVHVCQTPRLSLIYFGPDVALLLKVVVSCLGSRSACLPRRRCCWVCLCSCCWGLSVWGRSPWHLRRTRQAHTLLPSSLVLTRQWLKTWPGDSHVTIELKDKVKVDCKLF